MVWAIVTTPSPSPASQRFGSLLQFSPHFHSWLPDGVLHVADTGELAVCRLDPPQDRDVQMLVARIEQRIDRFLAEDDCADVDGEQALLAREQHRTLTPRMSALPLERPLCAASNGYSLHADLAVPADDRKKLERGLRYGLRHPFAQRRLSLRPDGKVVLKLRKPYYGRPWAELLKRVFDIDHILQCPQCGSRWKPVSLPLGRPCRG